MLEGKHVQVLAVVLPAPAALPDAARSKEDEDLAGPVPDVPALTGGFGQFRKTSPKLTEGHRVFALKVREASPFTKKLDRSREIATFTVGTPDEGYRL